MSQLKLSGDFVASIRQVISQHDSAAEDPGVASQYLSAVIGFLLGQEEMPDVQKQEILEELMAFAGQVAADVSKQHLQLQAPLNIIQVETHGPSNSKTYPRRF